MASLIGTLPPYGAHPLPVVARFGGSHRLADSPGVGGPQEVNIGGFIPLPP